MPYDTFNTYGGASAMHEDTATTKAAKKDADVTSDKIRFMVMSGFLGAGKTTTMIALGEHMNKTYGKVGIIANDLGANLVDTNLTQTSGCTVEEIASGIPGVKHTVAIAGQSLLLNANAPNFGSIYVMLDGVVPNK